MTSKTVVMVTGVADVWGRRLSDRLLSDGGYHVIGLDLESPAKDIPGLDFVPADVRNPAVVDLLKSEGVEIVCHLKFSDATERSESTFDLNVMGTMKLLGACAEAGVRKVVLKSSTAVYGAFPDNSAFLTEDAPLRGSRNYGYTRDQLEIEAFCSDFRQQSPQVTLTILRAANVIGLSADTPMNRFLKQKPVPILLGFDPLMQLVHEDDVVEALAHAVQIDAPGVFNIAAEGTLPLSQMLRLMRRPPLPILHPLAYRGLEFLRVAPIGSSRCVPIEWPYLRYPCVADLSKMRNELGFSPQYTAAEALRELAASERLKQHGGQPGAQAYEEQRLRDTIERRQRARAGRRATRRSSEE